MAITIPQILRPFKAMAKAISAETIVKICGPPLVQWTCCFSCQNWADLWQTIARSQHVLLLWLMVKRGRLPPYFMVPPPFWCR